MGLRDLALMRTLHNIEILHPVDGVETQQMMTYIAGHNRPIYLRLCRQPLHEVHNEGHLFRPGQPDVLREGREVALLTMGGMVPVLIDALPELARHGLAPTVVNVSSLPVDADQVRRLAAGHGQVIVIEDHFIKGGLADEIGRSLLDMAQPPRFGAWGIGDYSQSGSPSELYQRYRLDAAGISEVIQDYAHGRRPQPRPDDGAGRARVLPGPCAD